MTTTEQKSGIPEYLWQDRYWRGMLYLFVEQPKLNGMLNQYIDLENGIVDATAMKKISRPWSQAEKFLLNLALHLFDESNKVNLSDMDYLDPNNKQLALKAIQLRFS